MNKKSSLLIGGTIFALATAIAQPAVAQEAAPACLDANNNGVCDTRETANASDSQDAIVVVGSRIRRENLDTAAPVTIITRDESTAAGFSSTTEALQGTGVTGGSEQINSAFGGFVTDGGPGANTLSLRGLGATRTLILLNGRRVAPAGTRGSVGSTDLNVLPSAIVDHFEILRDGASSIYGSDAVAGVVNIVTRNRIQGLNLEAQVNVPEIGAGTSFRVAAVAGATGDNWSVSGSLEYYRRNEVTLGDTDFTRCQIDGFRGADRVNGSDDFIDPRTGRPKCYPITTTGSDGVTINTIGTANLAGGVGALGAVGTVFNRWRPNTAVAGRLVGFEGVGGPSEDLNLRDTFEPRNYQESLFSPVQTYSAFLQASYDTGILGDAELYLEGLFNRRESQQNSYRQLTLDFSSNSPLLPANLRGLPAFLNPTLISNGQLVSVRAFIGSGIAHNEQTVDFYKVGGGLRGDFAIPGWRYDLFVGSTWSDASYTMDTFLTDRIAQSLDVVASGSGFVCRNTANGCVAAPTLTNAVIGGQLPQDWLNFVSRPVTGTTKYDEQVINLVVDGSLFSLPYGDVKVAVGGELRWASIDDTPSIDSQNSNLYNLTASAITRGKDSVREVFGEVEIPILRGIPFAEELTFNGSARYTDYDSYGSDFTYKVGGIWSPTKWLSLRTTYGTSYRAPALYEQFLGATTGFLASTVDPCDNYGVRNPTSIRYINCAADGLPTNFVQRNGVQITTTGGAAAGLDAETSTNWTVGLVFQPDFGSGFGDLALAVDYYDIAVRNGVVRLGGRNILNACYDDPDFRAGGGFCNQVDPRDANNRVFVTDNYLNLSQQNVRGIDYTLRYARDIGQGRFRLNVNLQQYLEQSSKLFATDALDDFNGTLNNPKFAGTFTASYELRGWRLTYGLDWIDGTSSEEYLGLDPETTFYDFSVSDYFTHRISLRYKADDFEITMGVQNLFNADLPQISSGYYNRIGNAPLYSGYDYMGRTFFLNVSTGF